MLDEAHLYTGIIGVAGLLIGEPMPRDGTRVFVFAIKLSGFLSLGGCLWVVFYCGILLGDLQGGYWVKAGAKGRNVAWFSGAAILGISAYTGAICRYAGVPLNPPPAGRAAVAEVLTQVTYSLGEEAFYRGCIQSLLVLWLARVPAVRGWAVTIAALLFMLQHATSLNQDILNLIIFPGGVLFGFAFQRFGFWVAAGVHFATNLVLVFCLPRFG